MKKYTIIFLVLLFSCDLLDTRDPEPPDMGGETIVAPKEEHILFSNLIYSFREKNLEYYISCFVDASFSDKQFKFIPSTGSISAQSWDMESERTYFNNLRVIPGEGIPITLTLSNEIRNPLGDSAVYQYDYSLIVPVYGQQESNTYKGTAIFRIYKDSRQQWAIGEWEDIKLDNFMSWSDLKGRYY